MNDQVVLIPNTKFSQIQDLPPGYLLTRRGNASG